MEHTKENQPEGQEVEPEETLITEHNMKMSIHKKKMKKQDKSAKIDLQEAEADINPEEMTTSTMKVIRLDPEVEEVEEVIEVAEEATAKASMHLEDKTEAVEGHMTTMKDKNKKLKSTTLNPAMNRASLNKNSTSWNAW
jgi:hypothetical protein